MEEEDIKQKKEFEIGANLDNWSINELNEFILVLKDEVIKVEETKKKKIVALNEAKNIFKEST